MKYELKIVPHDNPNAPGTWLDITDKVKSNPNLMRPVKFSELNRFAPEGFEVVQCRTIQGGLS